MEIGLVIAEDDRYNPEPDVTVIDFDVSPDEIYASKFYFVAEVLSPNDKPSVLAAKLSYYQAHPTCIGVIFVYQDRIEALLHAREQNWTEHRLEKPSDRIAIPLIGDIGALAELYRETRLRMS